MRPSKDINLISIDFIENLTLQASNRFITRMSDDALNKQQSRWIWREPVSRFERP